MYVISKNDKIRFNLKIRRGRVGECWVWTGNTNDEGYGYFLLCDIKIRAHRISYEIHKGPIPPNLCVLHTCDNPTCVKPSHLFLGTIADNNADKKKKGRASRVVVFGFAKLTWEQAQEIRNSPLPAKVFVNKYGISRSTVSEIRTNKHWTKKETRTIRP